MPTEAVRQLRAVSLAGLIGLIVLGLAWELWLAPTGNGTLAWKVLPLVLPLAGLLRNRWSLSVMGCLCAELSGGTSIPQSERVGLELACMQRTFLCGKSYRAALRSP